jgi:uncharacterized protein
MLKHTFCHIRGIGETTEQKLWSGGIASWDCAFSQIGIKPSRAVRESWRHYIQESVGNHSNRNLSYFAEKLPFNQHWRLYQDFQDSCAFVDIETTGLSAFDEITTIVLYDGRSVRHYVNGDNLDNFPADVKDCALLVTYNGKCFDIPFIERYFRIQMPQAHIDLRYPLRSLGLKGGLKNCEKHVGLARPGLENVDGFVAIELWKEYRKRKNAKALETLLAYNIQDTLSLHALMVYTHNEKLKATPFAGTHSLPSPSLPSSPFQADHNILARILSRLSFRIGAVFPTSFPRPALGSG